RRLRPLTPDPSDAWSDPASGRGEDYLTNAMLASLDWTRAGTVTHTFTHFHLELDVMVAFLPKSSPDFLIQRSDAKHRISKDRRSVDARNKSGHDGYENEWFWLAPDMARLPTVMKKAVELAAAEAAHPGESRAPVKPRNGSWLASG
ncbi:MAG: hypothetical protein ACOZAA_07565, partial [Pseudomonadota bacterium]